MKSKSQSRQKCRRRLFCAVVKQLSDGKCRHDAKERRKFTLHARDFSGFRPSFFGSARRASQYKERGSKKYGNNETKSPLPQFACRASKHNLLPPAQNIFELLEKQETAGHVHRPLPGNLASLICLLFCQGVSIFLNSMPFCWPYDLSYSTNASSVLTSSHPSDILLSVYVWKLGARVTANSKLWSRWDK